MKDLFGRAMLDYFYGQYPVKIVTETSISDADEMDIEYMFRDYIQMPIIEQNALGLCKGNVLDVGCGAGSHSLFLQNQKNLKVTAIDFSVNAIKTCKLRGVQHASVSDFFEFSSDEKFDTILLLMNGTGICGKIAKINLFLQKLKFLLSKNGQVLIDSTDIRYMFDRDANNNIIYPFEMEYFGELQFFLSYNNDNEVPFDWLYLDFEILKVSAAANGFYCEKIIEGDNFEYLARLSLK